MNPELDKKLVETYPKLYRQRNLPMNQTCMNWGFECGDGWFDIINRLSAELEWLNNIGVVTVEAVQVKEKFGTLRFYESIREGKNWTDDFPIEIIEDLIDEACAKSAYTCEVCGSKHAHLRSGGWLRTLCDEHAKECGYEEEGTESGK